jgi:hypothetical protein
LLSCAILVILAITLYNFICKGKTILEQGNNTYIIDAESGTEMARLIDQQHMMTRAMSGLLPADFQPAPDKVVLDLACGPSASTSAAQ